MVEEDNDKPVVIALREIAENISLEDTIELEAPEGMTLDQDQSQEPVEISLG